MCNCNDNDDTEDSGIITAKSLLPIQQFNFGPLNTDTGSQIRIKIGDLKCSGVQPIDCIWGPFQPASQCSETCGAGVQSFTRVKIQESKYGGSDCEGYPTELRSCIEKPCPVDCKWGPFKPSSECSKICGGRLKNFTRNIIQEANHGGTECIGDATKQESCNEGTCTPPTGNITVFSKMDVDTI